MRGSAAVMACVLVGAIASAMPALASDVDQFGFGARPISMGGAFAGLATDFTATYYNPGGLAAGRSISVGAGFSYGHYDLSFDSEAGRNDGAVERQAPLSGLTLGIASLLDYDRSKFLSRFGIGVGVFLPTRQIVGADVESSPGSPQFFLYGSRRDKIAVLPALSFRILPLDPAPPEPPPAESAKADGPHPASRAAQRPTEFPVLSFGVGATVLADIQGDFTFDLSGTSARSVQTRLKLPYDAAPNVGVFFYPADWISLGLTYRGELSLKADLDVQIVVDGANLFPLQLEAVTLYQPHQVAGGVAVDPLDWLTVAFDLTWQRWSAYEDPFVTIRPVIPQADIGFDDVVIPRIGFEAEAIDGLVFRAGYYYQTSPIPPQGGATNLIDLDKHVLSFGAGYTYWTTTEELVRVGDRAEIVVADKAPLSVDAFFQVHLLESERVAKDPSASPQTGSFYEAGGQVYNFGVQITIRL